MIPPTALFNCVQAIPRMASDPLGVFEDSDDAKGSVLGEFLVSPLHFCHLLF